MTVHWLKKHQLLKMLIKFPKLLLVVILLGLTTSCIKNDKNEKEISALKIEILAMHDSLMLELPVIKKVSSRLNENIVDSIREVSANKVFNEAIVQLDSADKAMWDWMHHFDISYQNKSDSLELSYYKTQYKDLGRVQASIDSAIINGKRVLINYDRAQ